MAGTTTSPKPVFVFGSRLDGVHQSESAKTAMRLYGAEPGSWSGPTGHAYVVPYLASDGTVLPLSVIANYVEPLIEFANQSPDKIFQIARFGGGANNHSDQDLARLFRDAPGNCRLPGVWSGLLDSTQAARLLVFDPSVQNNQEKWRERFEQYLSINAPLWGARAVEVVSVGTARAIVANDKIARQLKLKHCVFGPNETVFGDDATIAAEFQAVWHATHVLSVADFEQTAQAEQMRIMRAAARAGLQVDHLDVNAA